MKNFEHIKDSEEFKNLKESDQWVVKSLFENGEKLLDKDFTKEAFMYLLKIKDIEKLKMFPSDMRNNAAFISYAFNVSTIAIEAIGDTLRNDEIFMANKIKVQPFIARLLSPRLQKSYSFFLKIVGSSVELGKMSMFEKHITAKNVKDLLDKNLDYVDVYWHYSHKFSAKEWLKINEEILATMPLATDKINFKYCNEDQATKAVLTDVENFDRLNREMQRKVKVLAAAIDWSYVMSDQLQKKLINTLIEEIIYKEITVKKLLPYLKNEVTPTIAEVLIMDEALGKKAKRAGIVLSSDVPFKSLCRQIDLKLLMKKDDSCNNESTNVSVKKQNHLKKI